MHEFELEKNHRKTQPVRRRGEGSSTETFVKLSAKAGQVVPPL